MRLILLSIISLILTVRDAASKTHHHDDHMERMWQDLKMLLQRASRTSSAVTDNDLSSTPQTEVRPTATFGGGGNGANCVFPFTYKEALYTSCIGIADGATSWCATTDNYDNDKLWGYCLGVVQTTGGNGGELPCVWPFEYAGKNHSTCITTLNDGVLWCATTSNYTADGKWANCRGEQHEQCITSGNQGIPWCYTMPDQTKWGNCRAIRTSGGSAGHSYCTFPFTYNSVTYSSCTTEGSWDLGWCSTTQDFENDRHWGYCREIATIQGNANDSACVFPYIYQGASYNVCLNTSDGRPWCATTDNYDTDGLWGYCRGTCGYRPIVQSGDRIVGGFDAIYGAFPWTVAIPKKFSWGYANWCGGTVISDRWVLSAAHCFRSSEPKDHAISAGSLFRKSFDPFQQILGVEKIISHTSYDSVTHDYDIALLRVDGRIYFNNYSQPACLPGPDPSLYQTGVPCVISGWGRLEYHVGVGSDQMQAANVPLVETAVCKDSYQHVQKTISARMVCAGFMEGGIDTCSGDSGGPLVSNITGIYTVLGVTSFGYRCAEPNYPGVYTKVQDFLPWIQQTINQYS